jgi:hypothetical protein
LGLLLCRAEHNADLAGALVHPDGYPVESNPAEAIRGQPREDARPQATAESDASAAVRQDAAEAACLEPHRLDVDAGKLVVLAPDVQELDAQVLPPEPSAKLASEAPCRRAEVLSAERSFEAMADADVTA